MKTKKLLIGPDTTTEIRFNEDGMTGCCLIDCINKVTCGGCYIYSHDLHAQSLCEDEVKFLLVEDDE